MGRKDCRSIQYGSMSSRYAAARAWLASLPQVSLGHFPTPVEELPRLRAALGGGPRLLVKRDDAISFGFGGNKVRKLQFVMAQALAEGADTLITTGSIQSNHCRGTAAAAAKLGLHCHIVAHGQPPPRPTANALLDQLLGASVEYVPTRDDRAAAVDAAVARLRAAGQKPFVIPLGASTPLGALGYVHAVGELASQGPPPQYIFHSTSSGGTQSGMVAGCELYELPTRVVGISADDSAADIQARVRAIISGIGQLLGLDGAALAAARPIEVDAGFVGDGYGMPTAASAEAQELAARTEAVFVDHTYTAKALAGLIAWIRAGRFQETDTVLFWHTGGQVALFA